MTAGGSHVYSTTDARNQHQASSFFDTGLSLVHLGWVDNELQNCPVFTSTELARNVMQATRPSL